MALNVMTWNIEQFGETRSGNVDIIGEVCRQIYLAPVVPDIIVLIEIKTADPKIACMIAKSMSDWIYGLSGNTRRYNYIITFCNNLEIYVYLYLAGSVVPLTLAEGIHKSYFDDPNKKNVDKLIDLDFIPTAGVNSIPSSRKIIVTEKTILNSFPLFKYDKLGFCRPPGVGFFRYGMEVIAIVAWHNMSGNDDASYTHMMNMANSFFVQNQRFRIKISGAATNVTNILVTGDFNLDYCGNQGEINAYNAFHPLTARITTRTYLEHYIAEYGYPDGIYSAGFDNHLFFGTGITVNQAAVLDIPYIYKNAGMKDIFSQLANSQFIGSYYDADDELTLSRLHNYLENKLKVMNRKQSPRITATDQTTIINEVTDQIKKARLSTIEKLLPETKVILGNYFSRFATNLYNYYTGPAHFKGYRYSIFKKEPKNFQYSDALFICRRFASDHLPVIIRFN